MEWMQFWNRRKADRVPEVIRNDLAHCAFEELTALSASRSGYDREAAVTELLRRENGRAIGALLPRASDYIPAIRAQVMAALPRYLTAEFVPDWIAARDQLMSLYRVRRVDLSSLRDSIEQFLLPYAAQLTAVAGERDRGFDRWLFALRLRGCLSPADTETLVIETVASADALLANRAMAAAERLPDAAASERAAMAALRSPLPKIRADAVRLLMRAPQLADRPSLLRAACFDSGGVVRSLAFGGLDDAGRAFVEGMARRHLEGTEAAPGLRAASLHVLALAKVIELPALALACVDAPSPSLRAAAWACRWQAPNTAAVDELEKALVDPSSTVRRVALKRIKAGAPGPSPEWLRAVGLERPHCLGTVMSVFQHASPWERFRFLLDALAIPDLTDAARSSVMAEVQCWSRDMASCYVRPASSQAEAIRASWLLRPHDANARAHLDRLVATHLQAFDVI